MSDVITKKIDKISMMIAELQRNLPKIRQQIDEVRREQHEIHRQVDEQVRRLTLERGAMPPAWAALATHDEPLMMQ